MIFTAIDFETANFTRASVCSVGIITIEDGRVVNRLHQLIRPEPCRFEPFNIGIHGITENDVASAPSFEDFWPTLCAQLVGPLVAHNASFDMSVLRKALDQAALKYPDTDYFCTRVISRLLWPDRPTYALSHLAGYFGITFNHHNAESDAHACALIALEACRTIQAESLYDISEQYEMSVGRLYDGGYFPCSGFYEGRQPARRRERVRASEITPTRTSTDESSACYGKSFVFTGAMSAMSRIDAMQNVVDRGGFCHDGVKKDTDYLVLGQNGFIGYGSGHRSGKIKRAEELIAMGHQMEIISEADFIQML